MTEGHRAFRRKLPDERASITHKFGIGGHEGYLTVGLYPDGTPGETFICMSKEGSTISGLMDTIAMLISLNLQYNVPLSVLVDKLKHMRFEPEGITANPAIRHARSIPDYIGRWLALKFLEAEQMPDYSDGFPVAESDPPPKPWTEEDAAELKDRHEDKIVVISPSEPSAPEEIARAEDEHDPVLLQAIEVGSGLTAAEPIDPEQEEEDDARE